MDEGLFKKYSSQIQKRNTFKKDIINTIKENTGILLKEDELVIIKNQIQLTVSSVVKQKLFQKNITTILELKGFILKG